MNLGTDTSGLIEGLILEPGLMALNGFGEVIIGGTVFFNYTKATVDSSARGIGIDADGQLHRLSSSSRRYKHSIATVTEEALDPRRLYGLPVKQYVFNEDYLSPQDPRQGQTVIGLIAEDVEEHYPTAVTYDKEGRVENWQERYILPAVLALLQEQHREIEALKERVSNLEKEDGHGR